MPKKIVSKGEYFQQFAKMLAWGMGGASLQIGAVICVLLSLNMLWLYVQHPDAFSWGDTCQEIFILLIWGIAYGLFRLGRMGLNKSNEAESEFLTRADVLELPADKSLVRASEQPILPQKAVLLRPATDTQEAPVEQLLRPS